MKKIMMSMSLNKKCLLLIFACLFLFSTRNAIADMVWTDGSAFGTGLKVEIVYPQFFEKKVIFKGNDGRFYAFPWDASSSEMTANARAVFSTLLTAMMTGQSVSIYYNNAETGYITFQLVNIHN